MLPGTVTVWLQPTTGCGSLSLSESASTYGGKVRIYTHNIWLRHCLGVCHKHGFPTDVWTVELSPEMASHHHHHHYHKSTSLSDVFFAVLRVKCRPLAVITKRRYLRRVGMRLTLTSSVGKPTLQNGFGNSVVDKHVSKRRSLQVQRVCSKRSSSSALEVMMTY